MIKVMVIIFFLVLGHIATSTRLSPGDIAARVGLDPRELEWPCDESLLPSLASYVENISIDEVCRLLEMLDEWEEVALHLGLSDQAIQEIRRLSGGNSVRTRAMVSKWVQCKELEPSWSKLEKALVSANQETYAAKIRARSHTPTKPGITTTATAPSLSSPSEQKGASGSDTGIGLFLHI